MQLDSVWKIMVAGEGSVGKTTLLQTLLAEKFVDDAKLTVGIEFHGKEIIRQARKIYMAFWDLGGQDRFKFLHDAFIKGARAAIVCFDMNRLESLSDARQWVHLIRGELYHSIPILLFGTKMDLVSENRQEDIKAAAQGLVDELGLFIYIPTSSKQGINIEAAIDVLIEITLWESSSTIAGATSWI